SVQLAQPPLPVEVAYADADVGLDLGTFALVVGGVDQSEACEVFADRAVCSLLLPAGSHSLEASVRDRVGNLAGATRNVEIALDPTPPTLDILTPDQPSYRGDPQAIAVEYSDAGGGLDLAGVRLRIDATDLTTTCAIAA